jgi:hypothetical protein
MRIVKMKENKAQELEKIYINEPSVLFVLSDKKHKPLIRIFSGV